MALRTCGDKGNENVYETRKTVQGNKFTLFLPFDSQNVPRRPIQIQYSPSYNCHFDGPKLINTITATVIKDPMYVYGGSYHGGGSYPWEEEGLIHVSQPHGNIPHWKSLHLYSRWLYILPNDRNRSSGHFLMLINYSPPFRICRVILRFPSALPPFLVCSSLMQQERYLHNVWGARYSCESEEEEEADAEIVHTFNASWSAIWSQFDCQIRTTQ